MTRSFLPVFTLFSALSALCSLAIGSAAAQQPAAAPASAAENPAPLPTEPAERPAPLIGPPVAGGLTAEQAAQRAASTSHDVRAKEADHEAAEHSVDQASAAFIPRLTAGASYTRLSEVDQPSLGAAVPISFPSVLNQYGLQAQLEIPLSDYLLRLPQLKAAAEHNERSAQLLAQAERLNVANDARVAYYEWARAQLQAEVAKRTLAQAQAHLKDVQVARDTGAASKADVLSVESQVASAELALVRAASAADLYDRRLHVILHDTGAAPYQLGEDLRDDGPTAVPAGRASDEHALVAQAQARRLEPRALGESAGAVREQGSSALAAELPRLSAVGEATYAQPNQRVFPQKEEFTGTWQAGVRLTWTPTDIVGTEASRSSSEAKARGLDEQRAAVDDRIALEVKQQLLALRTSMTAVETSQRGVTAAEESYRVRRALFQNGRATSVELTDAENEWSRAQLELIGARIDRRIAQARLIHALGEDAR